MFETVVLLILFVMYFIISAVNFVAVASVKSGEPVKFKVLVFIARSLACILFGVLLLRSRGVFELEGTYAIGVLILSALTAVINGIVFVFDIKSIRDISKSK